MKKDTILFIIMFIILAICSMGVSFARYQKQLLGGNITIQSKEYTPLEVVSVSAVDGEDNTYDVTITNPNSYDVNYKVIEQNDLYKVEYNGTTDTYATISTGETKTIRVVISGREDVIYEDMLTDSLGNLYKNITIVLYAINPYNANKIELATNQKIYLQKSIKNNIIVAAGEITAYEEGHTFNGVSSASEGGLCSIIDPVSGNTIYFYRGNTTNNYVSFAGHMWRILRINSDGSLRLILDDTTASSQYQTSNIPDNLTIEDAIQLINWKSSVAYRTLHDWYDNNISTENQAYVVQTDFVFDTSYEYTRSSATGQTCYYFGPYFRVGEDGNNYQPTFSYTEDSLIQDNVGLITADELLYAGAYHKNSNTSFFLYNSSISTACWTMSPSFWDDSANHKAGMMIYEPDGRMHDWPYGGGTITASLGMRPVISIRSDIEMSGDGTSLKPYKYGE